MLLLALLLQAQAQTPEHADLVLRRTRIATMNAAQPWAEAVAIAKNRIVFVGSDAEVAAWIGRFTQVHELPGHLVLPGFIESHAHLMGLGRKESEIDLTEFTSEEQIAERVKIASSVARKGEWVVGRGWDQNRWEKKEFPTLRSISEVSPDVPVLLTRVDGHAVWGNAVAIHIAGITEKTSDPEGGRILRDASGKPTGVFVDAAVDLLRRHQPEPTKELRERALFRAVKRCGELGITSFHDAGVSNEDLELYRPYLNAGLGRLRVYAMLHGSDRPLVEQWLKRGPEISDRVTVRAIKLYADGALGSRGAALLEDYADEPGNRGLPQISETDLCSLTQDALRAGFQICTHAIGDRANRFTLDAYEKAMTAVPTANPPRLRVEHAQILDAKDIPRFAKLGVIASMQPTHCTSDMPWVPTRIGEARTIEGAYAWRKLLDSGARIVCGSDAPVESVNPIYGIYAAVTRRDPKTKLPKAGFLADQRMNLIEAIRGYTSDAAYAAFAEKKVGSIEVGKLADLVVLKHDLFVTSPDEWDLDRMVRATVFDGQIIF